MLGNRKGCPYPKPLKPSPAEGRIKRTLSASLMTKPTLWVGFIVEVQGLTYHPKRMKKCCSQTPRQLVRICRIFKTDNTQLSSMLQAT
jgi:hypothetical protein